MSFSEMFRLSNLRFAIISFGVIALTFYLYGNNLRAQWGCIDDHEIAQALGSDHVMQFNEWWPELMKTEVGRPGEFSRCRPVYYGLRLLETILWGDSPLRWYSVRLVSIMISLAILWVLLSRWLGLFGGSLVTIWIASYRFWFDIYCRLGPSEIYAVLGLALFMYGFIAIIDRGKRKPMMALAMWGLVCSGSLTCIGSKENFLVMLPFVWIAGVLAWRRHGLRMSVMAGLLLVTTMAMFIVWAVGSTVSTTGVDIYAQSVTASSRLALLGLGPHGLLRATWWHMARWQVAGGVLAVVAAGWVCIKQNKIPSYVLRATLVIVGLAIFYVIQFLFYNGKLPIEGRYDFPGMLVVPLMWATVGWMLVHVADEVNIPRFGGAVRLVLIGALIAIVACNQKLADIRGECRGNELATRSFTSQMMHFAGRLKAQGEIPLTLLIQDAKNYEKIDAVTRFLRLYGVTNDMYLEYRANNKCTMPVDFDRELKRSLEALSRQGRPGILKPLSRRPVAGFVIELSRGDADDRRSLGYVGWFENCNCVK